MTGGKEKQGKRQVAKRAVAYATVYNIYNLSYFLQIQKSRKNSNS